jgi:hypothetical protein
VINLIRTVESCKDEGIHYARVVAANRDQLYLLLPVC